MGKPQIGTEAGDGLFAEFGPGVNIGLKVDTFIGFELDTFAGMSRVRLSPLRC